MPTATSKSLRCPPDRVPTRLSACAVSPTAAMSSSTSHGRREGGGVRRVVRAKMGQQFPHPPLAVVAPGLQHDAQARTPSLVPASRIGAEDGHVAGRAHSEAFQDLDRGRPARAVRAEQHDDFASPGREADPLQDVLDWARCWASNTRMRPTPTSRVPWSAHLGAVPEPARRRRTRTGPPAAAAPGPAGTGPRPALPDPHGLLTAATGQSVTISGVEAASRGCTATDCTVCPKIPALGRRQLRMTTRPPRSIPWSGRTAPSPWRPTLRTSPPGIRPWPRG